MRRRHVSQEDRDTVVRLRKSGAGWLTIQEMTGIPRRTAKGVYNEWQKGQAAEEVITARRQVAAEAFKLHMRDLGALAQAISVNLTDPGLNDMRNGKQVLDSVLESNIRVFADTESSFSFTKRDAAATFRQNHILFDSLKQHTQSKVNWDLLDKWSAARDDWHSGREQLEVAVNGLVPDMVNRQSAGSVGSTLKQPGTADKIARGIIETTYYALVDNEFEEPDKYIKAKGLQTSCAILFGGDTSDTELVIEDTKVAVIIAVFCKNIVKELFTQKEPSLTWDMAASLARMRQAHNELTDKLDELRLTPVILQTKCDICPA
ncbi:MAG: hypothetical protein KAV87_21960 [Desulfobacteraceae bacterium]|nr:hypothetical protein [Desulfobacteraceae bacterium]